MRGQIHRAGTVPTRSSKFAKRWEMKSKEKKTKKKGGKRKESVVEEKKKASQIKVKKKG